MKILGLVASYRKFGNTDILMRAALMKAKELGAEVSAIRLTDLSIKICKACYHCFWEPCRIDDDVDWVYDEMISSDAVIISSPTYILTMPGILKLLIDRVLSLYNKADKFKGKVAAVMVAYGIEGWAGNTLSLISSFLLNLGYNIIDRLVVRAAWPGEVLINNTIKRAKEIGEKIVYALKGKYDVKYTSSNYSCPICGSEALMILPNNRVKCIYCDLTGDLLCTNGKIIVKFPDNPYENSRWTDKRKLEHINTIIKSIQEYREYRDKVKNLINIYRNFNPYISKRV